MSDLFDRTVDLFVRPRVDEVLKTFSGPGIHLIIRFNTLNFYDGLLLPGWNAF
jgi:hypothetical protein